MANIRAGIVKKYKKAIDNARAALANDIVVYYKTGNRINCGTCLWDPVNKESLDPNCPECNGNFYQDEVYAKTIKASTSWVGLSDKYIPLQLVGGQINRGDVYISCKLSDVLYDITNISGETIFHRATKIDINGEIVYPKTTPIKYGLAGDLYSCALVASKDDALIQNR